MKKENKTQKSKVVPIRIDNDLHRRVKELCHREGRTVSGFIAWVLRIFMEGKK